MLSKYPIHATLPATDLRRATAFYVEKLGFTPGSEEPGGTFFTSGGTRFLLFPSQGSASGTHTQAGWAVDDIDAEVSDLKSRGVVFEEYDRPGFESANSVVTTGNVRAAWFRDSEGNLLGLVQYT
jgi:catechol 2,3-dioxygenase-like lactoylglutathione lyase family enzyme